MRLRVASLLSGGATLRPHCASFFFPLKEDDIIEQKHGFCNTFNFTIIQGDHEPISSDPLRVKVRVFSPRDIDNNV